MDNKNIGPNGNRYKDVTEDIKEIDPEKEENVDEDSPENIEAEIKKEEKLLSHGRRQMVQNPIRFNVHWIRSLRKNVKRRRQRKLL